MKVNYHLNRTKRSSWLVLLSFMVCTKIMIGISPYTSISSVPREVWPDSVIATIPVGDLPAFITFNAETGDMYVSNENANTVSVIDGQTNTVIGGPIPVGVAPAGSAFNPDNGNMYVANP